MLSDSAVQKAFRVVKLMTETYRTGFSGPEALCAHSTHTHIDTTDHLSLTSRRLLWKIQSDIVLNTY